MACDGLRTICVAYKEYVPGRFIQLNNTSSVTDIMLNVKFILD